MFDHRTATAPAGSRFAATTCTGRCGCGRGGGGGCGRPHTRPRTCTPCPRRAGGTRGAAIRARLARDDAGLEDVLGRHAVLVPEAAGARAAVESLVLRAHDCASCAPTTGRAPRTAPRVGVVVIHPRVDFSHHYAVPRLVAPGSPCSPRTRATPATTRWPSTRRWCSMSGACVRYLRREARRRARSCCSATAAAASLVAFYQAQAALPPAQRLARSPGGARRTSRRRAAAGARDDLRRAPTAGRARCCSTRSIRRSSTSAIRSPSIRRSTCTIRATASPSRRRGRSTRRSSSSATAPRSAQRVARLDAARASTSSRRRGDAGGGAPRASPRCPSTSAARSCAAARARR